MRNIALLSVAALTACSGGGTSPSPIVARAPIATSSAPASTSSQTRATFVIQWPATTQAASTTKRRQTLSPSTQSISVSVNGGVATVVNKPTLSGSPSTTSVSIPAPPGSDAFTFVAWDQLGGTGAILDQTTATQTIVANANNAVTVVLDGVCAALVPTLSGTPSFITYQNTTVPLVSGSRTVLQSARLIGPSAKTITFTRVDADGNTILTSAGVAPISVQESGTTPHVTIAPVAAGVANTSFTLTPTIAEPDGFATTISATSPDCGTATPTFPNSFQLSTSAEIVISDAFGIEAYDQDGAAFPRLSTMFAEGIAYNAKSGYLLAIGQASSGHGLAFTTLSPTGSAIGSGTFSPQNIGSDTAAASERPGQIVYDSVSGNFYITLQETSSVPGAVEEYSISGSTAAFVAASGMSDDPFSIAAISGGNLVVNDASSTDASNETAYTYDLSDTLQPNNESDVYNFTSLSFDTTRGIIIGLNAPPGSSGPQTGTLLNPVTLGSTGTFTLPGTPFRGIQTSVYNPGNDEFYMFDTDGNAYGLSGASLTQGGNTTSNLGLTAFTYLTDPQDAVVLP
jgi:hypothetical protein